LTSVEEEISSSAFETKLLVPNGWFYNKDEVNGLVAAIAPYRNEKTRVVPNVVVITRRYRGELPDVILKDTLAELEETFDDLRIIAQSVEESDYPTWQAYLEVAYDTADAVPVYAFQIIQSYGEELVTVTGTVAKDDFEVVADQMIACALTVRYEASETYMASQGRES
jgi:maltose-binding protein MalE